MTDTLQVQQREFAAHIRDPQANPPPLGIEDRRMAVYRDLFFNNLLGLLSSNFPVIRQTLDESAWHELVRTFYATHRCQTPLFAEIGHEFVGFLQAQEDETSRLPPWLAELAHYEWVELALQLSDAALPPHDPVGDLADRLVQRSPLAWPLAYAWPVHRIGPEFQPDAATAAPTLLLVRRDETHQVHFSELSPLVFRLLELVDSGVLSGRAAIAQLAIEAGQKGDASFIANGLSMLQRMREEGTIFAAGKA